MDLNYLFHRQQVERARADAADSVEARAAHDQLARCYQTQITQATEGLFYQADDRVAPRPATSTVADRKTSDSAATQS
jgi:hypothetical protein